VPHDVDIDTLIVGAGPAGLYAAYCAGFRGRSVAVMDSLPEVGGQVCAMYPEKLIYDVAGLPAVRGRAFTSRPLDALAGVENSTSAEVVAASDGGWIRLISVGFGEAAMAVNNAIAALDPGAPLFPGHSSDLGGEHAFRPPLTSSASAPEPCRAAASASTP
jgi:threonine dehydrogenase-like Zn-dependent dehydrogenase